MSDVLIEEPLHERHVVDFLRNTEWGSGTVSIYAQICFPVNCQHICAYFAIYLPTYLPHIPNFIHMFHMFILYILTCLSVNFPHMYQICSLNLDDYVFFQFVYVTTCLSHSCPTKHIFCIGLLTTIFSTSAALIVPRMCYAFHRKNISTWHTALLSSFDSMIRMYQKVLANRSP